MPVREKRSRQVFDDDWEDVTPPRGSKPSRSPREVAAALRSRELLVESEFDQFLPPDLRRVSGRHWTPLVVALRVAEWFDSVGVRTAVDIGAGVGKFCVAVALASRCDMTGIEQRPRLVDVAQGLARVFGIGQRVQFVSGTLRQGVIPEADAYYVYNPFGENLFGPEAQIDGDVELSGVRYERDVALMEEFLDRARMGTYVVKYNGFGGVMPAAYTPIRVDRDMPNVLRMWQKTGPRRGVWTGYT